MGRNKMTVECKININKLARKSLERMADEGKEIEQCPTCFRIRFANNIYSDYGYENMMPKFTERYCPSCTEKNPLSSLYNSGRS